MHEREAPSSRRYTLARLSLYLSSFDRRDSSATIYVLCMLRTQAT